MIDCATLALRTLHPRERDSLEQALVRLLCPRQCLTTAGGQREVALGATAALRRRIAEPRAHEALVFETFEGGIDGARRRITASATDDFVPDWHSVGVVAQPQHGEHDDLFELTK